jgi:signal transduction histidine kinase
MLEVRVKDNGEGIAEEDISKLFKSFGKLKRTQRLNKQGIGLGLHICK